MPRVDNTKFYNTSLKKHKKSPKALHWASKSSQIARFEIFEILLRKELRYSIIVDAGCGFGDLYIYLKERAAPPLKYIGIDSHKKIVNLAREATSQEIIHADILRERLPQGDYYLCSGAMNILEPFETLLFIKQMLRYARKGVLFNILKGNNDSATYNKYQPEQMRKLLGFFEGDIEIYDDYLENDFTVFMKKRMD